MHRVNKRGLLAAFLALILIGAGDVAKAKDADANTGGAEPYHLRMHHLHTGESIDVVYRVGDTYQPSAIAKLNYFLRDHRTQSESDYDPKEFDLLNADRKSVV